MRVLRQNKGYFDEIQKFIEAIKEGKESPIPTEELFEVTRVSFEIEKVGFKINSYYYIN